MAIQSMHKDNVYTRWTRLGLEQVGQTKSIDLMIGAALGPVSSMTTKVALSDGSTYYGDHSGDPLF